MSDNYRGGRGELQGGSGQGGRSPVPLGMPLGSGGSNALGGKKAERGGGPSASGGGSLLKGLVGGNGGAQRGTAVPLLKQTPGVPKGALVPRGQLPPVVPGRGSLALATMPSQSPGQMMVGLSSGESSLGNVPGAHDYLAGSFSDWIQRAQQDAAEAFQEKKYAKAEYYLRQLLNMTRKERGEGGGGVNPASRPVSRGSGTGSRPGTREGSRGTGEGGSRPGTREGSKGGSVAGGGGSGAGFGSPAGSRASSERRGGALVPGAPSSGEELEDGPEVVPILYRLSQCLRPQKRWPEEEDSLRRCLAILEGADGADEEATRRGGRGMLRFRVLTDLAGCTARKGGGADVAEEGLKLAERALYVAERLYGPISTNIAEPMCRVAAALGRLARYPEAEHLLQRAHTIRCRSHGERHPETGRVLCLLAQVYKRMGKFERAARYDALWRKCPSAERHRHQMRDPEHRAKLLQDIERKAEGDGANLGLAIVTNDKPLGRTTKHEKWRGVVPKMDFSALPDEYDPGSSDDENPHAPYTPYDDSGDEM